MMKVIKVNALTAKNAQATISVLYLVWQLTTPQPSPKQSKATFHLLITSMVNSCPVPQAPQTPSLTLHHLINVPHALNLLHAMLELLTKLDTLESDSNASLATIAPLGLCMKDSSRAQVEHIVEPQISSIVTNAINAQRAITALQDHTNLTYALMVTIVLSKLKISNISLARMVLTAFNKDFLFQLNA